MVNQPEYPEVTFRNKPAPEPVEDKVEAAPAPARRDEPEENDDPITGKEVAELVAKEVSYVKNAILRPLWRTGRQYLRSLEEAGDAVADGLSNKKDKR